ncbi:MAG: NAD(+) diphosphatase [Kiloniellaceae bacterium]|nr:NAD(+) diphosphatase [Kiloniellaceae bacterium]
MPKLNFYAPNFYAGVPLDRADRLRGDAERLAALLEDPRCCVVPLWRSQHLIAAEAEAVVLRRSELDGLLELAGETIFLGLRDEVAYLAIDFSHLEEPQIGPLTAGRGSFQDLRAVGPIMRREDGALLAYARGLAHWHGRHGFCGVCGTATVSEKGGHQRRCANADCNAVHFPRTDPAVIMLVHDGGERCLLGRQPFWQPGMHSTLAGFVEPGESLEEAVAREIWEEVGLKIAVAEVDYHSSQPWPFPSSIMLGFHARADYGPLDLGPDELESARWYSRAELRDSPEDETFKLPRRDSIARRLIEDWLAEG